MTASKFHWSLSVAWLLCWLPLMARTQPQLQLLRAAATAADEVVVGSDMDHVVLLSHSGEAGENWMGAETRMARITSAPWKVKMPEVWGHVPQRREIWAAAGEILHLDIDPAEDMAVMTGLAEGKGRIWLSARRRGAPDSWRQPWPVPALLDFAGTCAFAVFDDHPDREGDLLVALRPAMQRGAETLVLAGGQWKGGFDMARIPRRGGYGQVWLLDEINSAADEMALVPGPDGGGWLSTERLRGKGGIDPWWCPLIPSGINLTSDSLDALLKGHTLEVFCGMQPVLGLRWKATAEGRAVADLSSDEKGLVSLDMLKAGRRYIFELEGAPPEDCLQATAVWRDPTGAVIRRWSLDGRTWRLSFLTALPLGGWRTATEDLSKLPEPQFSGPKSRWNHPDWVVFHRVGKLSLTPRDQTQLRALAQHLKSRPEDVVHIVGHASPDGNPQANVRLAAERARHVAAQLEFAGLPSAQIRFEGMGDELPLKECPPGVSCPQGELERSRRTELHIRIANTANGTSMQ